MEGRQVIAIMAAIIYAAGLQGEPIAYPDAVDAARTLYASAQKIPFGCHAGL